VENEEDLVRHTCGPSVEPEYVPRGSGDLVVLFGVLLIVSTMTLIFWGL
jgi:hypothetical protein